MSTSSEPTMIDAVIAGLKSDADTVVVSKELPDGPIVVTETRGGVETIVSPAHPDPDEDDVVFDDEVESDEVIVIDDLDLDDDAELQETNDE